MSLSEKLARKKKGLRWVMAKHKDWYWEAEQDKIAADEMLRLVRSPEGWPDDGLACVGLWFFMMNQMWRSPRVGYLCDLVETHLPLKTTKLATMVGRDVQVVEQVQQVLIRENFFSITPENIIYSRGIVRKAALRKKRASAGRKGGRVSASLLKQNVEQNEQQSLILGIGIGIENLNGSVSEIAARLAQKAAFLSGKGTKASAVADWNAHISDLLAAGVSAEAINSDLDESKGSRGSRKSEPPWDFAKRLSPPKSGKGKTTLSDAIGDYAKWAEGDGQ